jgi:hypothetical protein
MKWLSILLLLALFSCENNAEKGAVIDSTEDMNTAANDTAALSPELPLASRDQYYIWEVDSDQKTKRKNPQAGQEIYNIDSLLIGLNEKYPQIRLEKKTIGHDTLYAEIKDAQYLTERMGSTGSEQYIAQAVLNLTAVQGINYVRIDFAEGSHASPDVWSRKSFSDYKEVKD